MVSCVIILPSMFILNARKKVSELRREWKNVHLSIVSKTYTHTWLSFDFFNWMSEEGVSISDLPMLLGKSTSETWNHIFKFQIQGSSHDRLQGIRLLHNMVALNMSLHILVPSSI